MKELKVVEYRAVATFPEPFRKKMSDQAVCPCVNGDVESARRALGDWVTRVLEAAPVWTEVVVTEVTEKETDRYSKKKKEVKKEEDGGQTE